MLTAANALIQAEAIATADLVADEGNIPYAYQDSLGFWTIGIGILIDKRKGGKLFPEEIQFILHNRISKVIHEMQVEDWYRAVETDPVRLAALINMQFQLGTESDEEFINSFGFIAKKDWKNAAANLRASKWAIQTPKRANRVITMIETGRHP